MEILTVAPIAKEEEMSSADSVSTDSASMDSVITDAKDPKCEEMTTTADDSNAKGDSKIATGKADKDSAGADETSEDSSPCSPKKRKRANDGDDAADDIDIPKSKKHLSAREKAQLELLSHVPALKNYKLDKRGRRPGISLSSGDMAAALGSMIDKKL